MWCRPAARLAFDLDTYRLLLKHLAAPHKAGLELKLLENTDQIAN